MSVGLLEQFVPQEFCCICTGCCRFADPNNIWRPKAMNKEVEPLKANQSGSEFLDQDFRIKTVSQDQEHICHFLDFEINRCRTYSQRPFECQLYPFVLLRKDEKVFVAVHLACPFVQEKKEGSEFLQYSKYLADFFSRNEILDQAEEYLKLASFYPNSGEEFKLLFSIFE